MPNIDLLKRKLISTYVYFFLIVLIIYALIYYFIVKNTFFSYYVAFYCFAISYTWFIIYKHYPVKKMVHLHLITGSFFSLFMMLNLWKYSVASSMWLLPIPLAAYIFFEKKISYLYSAYVVVLIFIVNIVEKSLQFDYFRFSKESDLIISDSSVFIVNILLIMMLLYYNEKIKKAHEVEITDVKNDDLPFLSIDLQKKRNSEEKNVSSKEIEKYSLLFERMKETIEKESHFKDADFSISQLAFILKTNNLYISNAIKQNNCNSFNYFINSYRINCAKELISQNDFNKITLMYIYTNCGFSNQSTFNRAFKQIEGITPSEFIKGLNKNNLRLI